MSLETLLEAAEFLEWRNHSKTRGDGSPRDPHGYSIISTNDSDASPESSNSGKFSGNDDCREKRRMGGAGTREVHNKLEKNRRAHLKECFEFLKNQIPTLEDKRTSNLSILRGSLRYIQALRRKEKEYEMEMQRLAREKINLQERISHLKSELAKMNIEIDLNQWVTVPEEQDTNSTSTATEQGSPICSEEEDEDELPPHRPKPVSASTAIYSEQQMHRLAGIPTQSEVSVPSKPAQLQLKPLTTQASMTVFKVTTPVTAASRNPVTMTTVSQSVAMPTTPISTSIIQQQLVAASRPPVTQILAQALNQRQQLQRQQSGSQVSTMFATTTATSKPQNQLKSIPQVRHPLTLTSLTAQLQGASHLAALNKLAGTAALSLPVSSIASGPSSSILNKSLGGPILVSPNIHLASAAGMAGVGSTLSLTSTTSAQQATSASPAVFSVASVKTSVAQNTVTTTAVSVASQVTMATPTITAMRPTVIGTAGTHQIMAGHLTPLNTLLTPTVPRTSIANQILPGVSNVVGTTQTTSSVQQVVSLAQMAPGTPIMSPMAVMAPSGLHLAAAASGLSQSHISSMLNQPLLKQIPIFSPGILQAGGQMIGQPVVKPLVFVTVPSIVATTSTPSMQVTTTTT